MDVLEIPADDSLGTTLTVDKLTAVLLNGLLSMCELFAACIYVWCYGVYRKLILILGSIEEPVDW